MICLPYQAGQNEKMMRQMASCRHSRDQKTQNYCIVLQRGTTDACVEAPPLPRWQAHQNFRFNVPPQSGCCVHFETGCCIGRSRAESPSNFLLLTHALNSVPKNGFKTDRLMDSIRTESVPRQSEAVTRRISNNALWPSSGNSIQEAPTPALHVVEQRERCHPESRRRRMPNMALHIESTPLPPAA